MYLPITAFPPYQKKQSLKFDEYKCHHLILQENDLNQPHTYEYFQKPYKTFL